MYEGFTKLDVDDLFVKI